MSWFDSPKVTDYKNIQNSKNNTLSSKNKNDKPTNDNNNGFGNTSVDKDVSIVKYSIATECKTIGVDSPTVQTKRQFTAGPSLPKVM